MLQARFRGHAYDTHRHDTYAVGVTGAGTQVFDYRGATHASRRGQVIVLHPDEAHNGRAGGVEGFAYSMVYVQPALLGEALRSICGRPVPLPFVTEPVSRNEVLARAVLAACGGADEPAALDAVLLDMAQGLLQGAGLAPTLPAHVNATALKRARDIIHAEFARPLRSAELEAATGLSRYDLARQFRRLYGTSPYRYLLMRRLEAARRMIAAGRALAEIAQATGFSDQPHFTRHFRATYGITPARHRKLRTVAGAIQA